MDKKKLGTSKKASKKQDAQVFRPKPDWVPDTILGEQNLCPDCFKVVGERSRYSLVCMLGKAQEGMSVNEMTEKMRLRQPTITHHLQVLNSVAAVTIEAKGRERIYRLNRSAHCFEECKIPY